MEKAVLTDTGILYALADRDDDWHARSARFVEKHRGRLLVPFPVVPEVCYLLNAYVGIDAELTFVKSLRDRELDVEHLTDSDLRRAAELLQDYRDANIGFVDAATVAVAERLRITDVLTTDRRHFGLVRPAHCPRFTLLP